MSRASGIRPVPPKSILDRFDWWELQAQLSRANDGERVPTSINNLNAALTHELRVHDGPVVESYFTKVPGLTTLTD